MPYSYPTFDDEIELYFQHAKHDSVLDIGAGEGKFGKLIRRVQPSARSIGVELDSSYIEKYALREEYDELLEMDAARLMNDVRRTFGAVIIGDVIEHMPKSVGVDLLNFLVYRAKVIFVKFPVQMCQNDWGGHLSEAHISVWSAFDFAAFDHIFLKRGPIEMAVIRGYLNRTFEWLPREVVQELGYSNCAAFYEERPERWELADRETRWRQQCDADLRVLIPVGDKFLMIDEEASGLLADRSSFRIPFIERNGQYYGMPGNDADALAELRRQHLAGVKWVIITENTFWAKQFYPGMMSELRTQHRRALGNDRLEVFELT